MNKMGMKKANTKGQAGYQKAMTKRKFAKGGYANCGASMKPNRKAKK